LTELFKKIKGVQILVHSLHAKIRHQNRASPKRLQATVDHMAICVKQGVHCLDKR